MVQHGYEIKILDSSKDGKNLVYLALYCCLMFTLFDVSQPKIQFHGNEPMPSFFFHRSIFERKCASHSMFIEKQAPSEKNVENIFKIQCEVPRIFNISKSY